MTPRGSGAVIAEDRQSAENRCQHLAKGKGSSRADVQQKTHKLLGRALTASQDVQHLVGDKKDQEVRDQQDRYARHHIKHAGTARGQSSPLHDDRTRARPHRLRPRDRQTRRFSLSGFGRSGKLSGAATSRTGVGCQGKYQGSR